DVQEDVVRPLPARMGKSRRAVVRGADIVPEHFEQLGQGQCRVTVVIDNKDSRRVIGCPGAHVTVLAPGWLGSFGRREADGELRSRVRAAALCCDARAVKFGEPLHQGQSDPQASLGASQGAVALGEELEHGGELFGGDANAKSRSRRGERARPSSSGCSITALVSRLTTICSNRW